VRNMVARGLANVAGWSLQDGVHGWEEVWGALTAAQEEEGEGKGGIALAVLGFYEEAITLALDRHWEAHGEDYHAALRVQTEQLEHTLGAALASSSTPAVRVAAVTLLEGVVHLLCLEEGAEEADEAGPEKQGGAWVADLLPRVLELGAEGLGECKTDAGRTMIGAVARTLSEMVDVSWV
jgi:hypothetical protein